MDDGPSQRSGLSRREFSGGSLATLAWLVAGCGTSGLFGESSTETDDQVAFGTDPDAALRNVYGTRRGRNTSPGADGVAVDSVVDGFNRFALDLHRAAGDGTDNVLVGPYSLATALALTMAGTAGSTRADLAALLGVSEIERSALDPAINALDLILEDRATNKLALKTANRLFVLPGLPLKKEFLDIAMGDYGAPVTEADFATRGDEVVAQVNGWVSEQTDGFLDTLVDSFDPGTVIALVNAVFLKAKWSVTFTDKSTGQFTTRDGQTVDVPMFGHDDFLPQYHDFESGVTAVEMPYDGGNISMVVIMAQDMDRFEESLDTAALGKILNGLREEGIHLALPKWEFEKKIDALKLLAPLGLPTGPGDFSPMFEGGDSGDFYIAQVDHKARIEVDETGTTAAAASDVAVAGSHGPTISIDRPFFYIIRDRGSGTILFAGTVNDPRDHS